MLTAIAEDHRIRIRDIAARCRLTERAVQKIIADLEEGGYLTHTREGRTNAYRIQPGTILRHPAEAIASHHALNPNLGRDEIGFAWLHEIFTAVRTATGATPVVIDSDDLLDRPAETVRAYCQAVGVPFLPNALNWQPGMRSDWQATSKWHESTSQTTGFTRGTNAGAEAVAADPVLSGYLDYHLPYYEELRAAALRP